MTEVSSTRLYLGNLPRNATKADVEAHFQTHGTGEITEIKLMNGFGFIEYKDAMDARDVVPGTYYTSAQRPRRRLLTDVAPSLPYVSGSFPAAVLPHCSVVPWLIQHAVKKMDPTSWASA